jgi:hypothetical protein
MARDRSTPEQRPVTTIAFREHTRTQSMFSAETASFRYFVTPASDRWLLRSYEMDTGSGSRVPKSFATHVADRDSKADCVTVAQEFHNLGDRYNELVAARSSGHRYTRRLCDRSPPRRPHWQSVPIVGCGCAEPLRPKVAPHAQVLGATHQRLSHCLSRLRLVA